MSASSANETTEQQKMRRKWRWIGLSGVICLLSWIALAVGLLVQVDTGTRILLVSAAAVTTEGTFWLAALLLGVSVFKARQRLWQTVKSLLARRWSMLRRRGS